MSHICCWSRNVSHHLQMWKKCNSYVAPTLAMGTPNRDYLKSCWCISSRRHQPTLAFIVSNPVILSTYWARDSISKLWQYFYMLVRGLNHEQVLLFTLYILPVKGSPPQMGRRWKVLSVHFYELRFMDTDLTYISMGARWLPGFDRIWWGLSDFHGNKKENSAWSDNNDSSCNICFLSRPLSSALNLVLCHSSPM